MSGTVAHALANTLRPVTRKDGTFDLVDVRTHNVVEHDRSLTRLDFRQGDNYTFQPQSAWPAATPPPLVPFVFPPSLTSAGRQCSRP